MRPEGILEWILTITLSACAIVVVALVALLIFWAVDSWWAPSESSNGDIIAKNFEEGHWTTTYIWNESLKMNMPMTEWTPDAWQLTIQIGDKAGDIGVTQETYNKLTMGQRVFCEYRRGRISNGVYIDTISY